MDLIVKKILAAGEVRAAKRKELEDAMQRRLDELKNAPEYRRMLRYKGERGNMFAVFRSRCQSIYSQLRDARCNPMPKFEFTEKDLDVFPTERQDRLAQPAEMPWNIAMNASAPDMNVEGTMRIDFDTDNSDEQIDFFGTITVLGNASARWTFFVSPEGKFFHVVDACKDMMPCPYDFSGLKKVLQEGATAVGCSFATVLDFALDALVTVAMEDGYPEGWLRIPDLDHFVERAVKSGADPYKLLGVSVDELKKLANVPSKPHPAKPGYSIETDTE